VSARRAFAPNWPVRAGWTLLALYVVYAAGRLDFDAARFAALLAEVGRELGVVHRLGTISGVERGADFEVLYHLSNADGTVTVRVQAPRSEPRIPSVCSVIPGAILYERELQDMFGLVVENIPDPRPLLLADDWPAGEYPLRKDWTFERPAEVIPGGK